MNIFSNDDQFSSDMFDNSWEQSIDNGYDSMINTDEQPFDYETYFQDTSYEPSFGHESDFQNISYEPLIVSESVDYTFTGLDNTFQDPQANPIFKSGLRDIEEIADKQEGGTCGFESIENMLQLYYPRLRNDTSNILQQYPELNVDGSLNLHYYDDILQSQGISSNWNEFDRQQIASALYQHRPVVVIVDAHDLDPTTYTQDNAWHAITLTSVDYDSDGNILGYRGIDSNFPGEEKYWQADVLEKASNEWRDGALANSQEYQINQQVLIPDQQALAWGNFSQDEQIA